MKLARLVAATRLAFIGIALMGCSALLAPALADEKADRAEDEAAIKQLGKAWQEAWNKHDMDALASLFAEDADFVTVVGRWLKGRKAIKEHHDKIHAMQFKESVFTTAEVQVKFLKPDIALVHVNWSMKGDKDPDGTPRQPRSGLFTWVVTKQGGDWLIQAAHNTNISAGAAPSAVQWMEVAAPNGGVMRAAVARPGGAGPFPAVLILHGTHGFAQQYVQLAQDLAARGGVVGVAACWFAPGSGPGMPFISPIECPGAPPMPVASSPAALNAVDALVHAVRALPDVRPDRVAVFGHSRGGGAALNYAMLRKGTVRAVVLNSTGYPKELRASDVSVPVLILHGTGNSEADGGSAISSMEMARDFEKALRKEGKRVEVKYFEGAGHNTLFTNSKQYDETGQLVAEFLKPPLVMLGGGTDGAAGFAPHAQVLAKAFRVLRPESLLIERSRRKQPLPPGYSIKAESAALARSLDQLALLEPADLVGHSFGALVALDFALDHPDRVRSLVLAEPPAFWVVPPAELRADEKMRTMVELLQTFGPTKEPTDDQVVQFRSLLGRTGVKPPAQGQPDWEDWVTRRSALRGLSAVASHTDDPERLKGFRRPVLIVTGKETVKFHRRINDILAENLPVVERVELTGGHGAPGTARDEFVAELQAFLARHR